MVDVVATRAALGLSVEQMARLLDVSAQSIFRWEHGKTKPAGPSATFLRALEIVSSDADFVASMGLLGPRSTFVLWAAVFRKAHEQEHFDMSVAIGDRFEDNYRIGIVTDVDDSRARVEWRLKGTATSRWIAKERLLKQHRRVR